MLGRRNFLLGLLAAPVAAPLVAEALMAVEEPVVAETAIETAGATAMVDVTNGAIRAISVISGGSGYMSRPVISAGLTLEPTAFSSFP